MTKSINRNKNTAIIVVLLIVCAVVFRILGNNGIYPITLGMLRTFIYIGLYIGWGISVSKRIVQAQVRRNLVAVALLNVFWFVIRSMKYYFVSDPALSRQLWYWYYFPMLFIPLFSVFVSMSLGKPENYRLPKWTSLLYIPTVLCLLLVVTNDFHQLVFDFPAGEVWSDKNYDYVFGYFPVIGWEIICALTSFTIMVIKCRLSQRKKYLPLSLLCICIVYAIIYASGAEWMRIIGGDLTAVQCLMFTAILESCIQCGLIQTNTRYDSLFEAGTFKAQITDTDYNIRYTSANSPQLSENVMRSAENGAVSLDKNTVLKSNPIEGGHVLWLEDISDIAALLKELEENKETIAESNLLEQENYRTKLKINTLQEKNRLYDLLQDQTAHQIDLLDSLFAQYNTETNYEKRRSLLAKIAVIGAYIKRRGNLMFIGEKSATTDTAELSLCLEESFANLELMGVECAIDIPGNNKIDTTDAIRVYDFFESVTEAAIDDMRSVWLKARSLKDSVVFHLEVECESLLDDFSELAESSHFEDGVWCFTLRAKKAGEQS
ncbi:MAG: histidine kinase N-terminal 7TM domain-containing protein [Ruminococcus bromii]|nr:histidine kinase N-terminal 7TM domain-containing protein [Ruminococcus bromii]